MATAARRILSKLVLLIVPLIIAYKLYDIFILQPASDNYKSVKAIKQSADGSILSPPQKPLSTFPEVTMTSDSNNRSTAGCLTFNERYAQCQNLKSSLSDPQLAAVFNRSVINHDFLNETLKEVVLFRIGTERWTPEYWLNLCSLILEVTQENRRRHIYLLTLQPALGQVPPEFHSLTQIINEDTLGKYYGKAIYKSGWYHGDLIVAWWVQTQQAMSDYDFIWSFESDVRFIGNYGWFLDHSYQTAKSQNGTFDKRLKYNGHAYDSADLIVWHDYPGYLGPKGYEKTDWQWAQKDYVFGSEWSNRYPENALGFWMQVFGISRRLAKQVHDMVKQKRGYNVMQEFQTPTIAAENGFKVAFVPLKDRRVDVSDVFESLYMNWVNGSEDASCAVNQYIHPVKTKWHGWDKVQIK